RMAQSDRFDVHFMSLGRRFLVALKRIPPPPGAAGASADSLRQMQAMSLVAAFVLPPMQDLVDACRPGNPVHDARRKTCRAIADALRRSDSLIPEMIGLRLQEWTARDAADKDDALARRRRLQWKMRQLSDVSGTAAMPPASQVGIMLAHENEVDGIDAMLLATRRPLVPPVHWQPPLPASASTSQAQPLPGGALRRIDSPSPCRNNGADDIGSQCIGPDPRTRVGGAFGGTPEYRSCGSAGSFRAARETPLTPSGGCGHGTRAARLE